MNIHNLKSFTTTVRQIATAIVSNGWGEATSGNFSWNITSEINKNTLEEMTEAEVYPSLVSYPELGGQVLLISTSGSRMRTLAEGATEGFCLLLMSEDGKSFKCFGSNEISAKGKPTSESPAHLEVHRFLKKMGKPDKAVLHTHMTEAIIATHHPDYKTEEILNSVLKAMQPEMTTFLPEGIGIVPYELPGSQKIGEATAEKIKNFDVVIWEKHGCFSVGRSLDEALDKQEIVAKSLQVLFRCIQYGYIPEGLTEKQLKELRKTDG